MGDKTPSSRSSSNNSSKMDIFITKFEYNNDDSFSNSIETIKHVNAMIDFCKYHIGAIHNIKSETRDLRVDHAVLIIYVTAEQSIIKIIKKKFLEEIRKNMPPYWSLIS